jgi:hypothetical protein
MKANEFNFERFFNFKEEMEKNYKRFLQNSSWEIPVIQSFPSREQFSWACRNKESSLEAQLQSLTEMTMLKTDLAFLYLEPWHGVGVYATAYGCKYEWVPGQAPQTRPVYQSLDEIDDIKKPDIASCDEMLAVLDMIRYFKEKTGGELDISLTDTQSPNDTGSLLVETTEFLTATIEEPERLDPLLQSITDLICQFSDEQKNIIGERFAKPGHIMISSTGNSGLSISDDNMAFLSPQSYTNTCLRYNNILSDYFGGLAVHTCGNAIHNFPILLQTRGLTMVDLAVGIVPDPTPNIPAEVADVFRGTNIIVKARLGWNEISKIEPLIDPGIRLIVQLITDGSIEERNRQYSNAKQEVETMKQTKTGNGYSGTL